ncbi:glutamine amidotransferase [Bradyrhizobium septentrionale]|uniref:Glutamine amidotransferase n=1 Tax=Bradyrhizobium septentrionale TaxID=1404411 RepID=A0ABZ2P628_9BRAD
MNSRRCLVIEHLSVEHAGTFKPALEGCGYVVSSMPAAMISERQDEVASADMVVVMGGPIGVYDAPAYPFLNVEISLLKERLASRKAILGICLGSQLLARAAGSKVYPGKSGIEIGWGPVFLTDAGRQTPLSVFGSETMVLHWHGDTFDLPTGAELLASTPKYLNQAFAIGTHALGLQFHVETTAEELEQWFVAFSGEIKAVQIPTLSELRRDTQLYSAELARKNMIFVERWIGQLTSSGG